MLSIFPDSMLIQIAAAVFLLTATASSAAENAEFVLTDMNQVQHRLSDYRGKWVLVN
jgi:hypothetical protein